MHHILKASFEFDNFGGGKNDILTYDEKGT